MGLVLSVILPVKLVKSPTAPAAKPWTELTIEAAKSAPGKLGRPIEIGWPPELALPNEDEW